MNKSIYTTTTNINGASYKLVIDHNKKTIKTGYNIAFGGEVVSLRVIQSISTDFVKAGYKVIND